MDTGNKRQKITEWLLDQIQKGILQEGKRIPSEYDLAERFQVNKMTANSAVDELVIRGYLERRSGAAGTIVCPHASKFKGTIAVFMGPINISYYGTLIHGIQEGAAAYGYNILLFHSTINNDPEETESFLKMARTDGAIITNFYMLSSLKIPVLWIDKNKIPELSNEFNHLVHNDEDGGRQLARHLYELGHRKIAYISQFSNILSRRYEGFRNELAKHSLPILTKEPFYQSRLSAVEFMRRLLKNFPETTAIACDGDNVAFEFYWALKEMGIRVPEDISLTGFSGFPEVQSMIKLTTVDELPHKIGVRAAELLIALIEKRINEPINEIFNIEFIKGLTTGQVRQSTFLQLQ